MIRRVLLALAFAGILAAGGSALADTTMSQVCYHVKVSMLGNVILPKQTICIPCPGWSCPASLVPKNAIITP